LFQEVQEEAAVKKGMSIVANAIDQRNRWDKQELNGRILWALIAAFSNEIVTPSKISSVLNDSKGWLLEIRSYSFFSANDSGICRATPESVVAVIFTIGH
jgi:hypothetical protein